MCGWARDAAGRHWAVKIVYRSSFDDDRPYEREYKGILRFFPVSAQSESQLRVMHVGRRDADGCFYYIMELADDASGAEQVRSDSYLPHTLRSELKCRRRIPASEVAGTGVGVDLRPGEFARERSGPPGYQTREHYLRGRTSKTRRRRSGDGRGPYPDLRRNGGLHSTGRSGDLSCRHLQFGDDAVRSMHGV
jgi:hypothetical protein